MMLKGQNFVSKKYINIILRLYFVVKKLHTADVKQVNETPKPKRKRPGFFKEIFLIYKYG